MSKEVASGKPDTNDQAHASRPGPVTWLVLIALIGAAVVALFGGFG